MPKVSINILTKNRAELLKKALASIYNQNFMDFEVVVVNDGSTDGTLEILKDLKFKDLKIVTHQTSVGITASRQEALAQSVGEYIAVLDDDDEWVDINKLKKQADYLDGHPDVVLVGGGIRAESGIKNQELRMRPESDRKIRNTMLFRNNFFTSTVMFRRDIAIKAGGFIKDGIDLAEDYDLWLRLGKLGEMYNFQEVFTKYVLPNYSREKFKLFLKKQLMLIKKHKNSYPGHWLATCILKIRLF